MPVSATKRAQKSSTTVTREAYHAARYTGAVSYHPAADEVHTAFTIPSGTPDRASDVEMVGDVFATMRDGVQLGADVYLPRRRGPAPAIVIRQPYGKRTDDMGMDVVG